MLKFLLLTAFVIAFVVGSALSLRPSPRQRQLARLRERAVALGLRVQWVPGGTEVDYLLPWELGDVSQARSLRFAASRVADGGWELETGVGPPAPGVASAMAGLPAFLVRTRAVAEGLQIRWNEAGTVDDVDRIALGLRALAQALLRGG